jgi:hypothetical protein
VRAATKYLGTWKKAIELAGLHYEEVGGRARYTDDEVVERLRRLSRQHPQLTARELHRTHRVVVATARRRFGSIESTLARAGLTKWPRRQMQKPLSSDELRRALQERIEAGESIVPMHLQRTAFPVYHSLCRIGPTPTKALVKLGVIDVDRGRRVWTKATVVDSIQSRMRHGLEPGANVYVLEGAIACFGTLRDASLAALRTADGRQAAARDRRSSRRI